MLLDQRDDAHYILGPPVAASNGSEFLVGWFSGGGYKRVFKVARVTLDGTVRAPGGIRLGDNVDFESGALVWHRDHWIAVWRGDRSTWMRRLKADGSFIDSSPVYLGKAWWPSSVRAMSNGETALVVWSDTRNIRGALFGEGLEYRDLSGIASAPRAIRPHSVGTDGDRYLVAYDCYWECDPGAPRSGMLQPRIWSIEVDGRSGSPLETRPQPLSRLLHQNGGIYGGAAIAHGSDWLILRTETPDPLVGRPENLFIGEQEGFSDADMPSIVRDGSVVVVAARRDGDVVYRIGHLPE